MYAIIIHGSWGNPNENWFPWLKAELRKLDYTVFAPKLPTPKDQKLHIWLNILKDYDKYLNEPSVVIAHSMGCSVALRKMELLDKPIKALFLIGAFTKDLWGGKYSDIINTFLDKPFHWKKIRKNVAYCEVYQSDNDPFVPVSMGKEISDKIGGKLIIVKNAGHFNTESGYTKFPLLLGNIKNTK